MRQTKLRDGFGNLTAKTQAPNSATYVSFSAAYDPTTNRQNDGNYDPNGNRLVGPFDSANQQYIQYIYDSENRVTFAGDSAFGYSYGYDPQGKRVMRQTAVVTTNNTIYNYEFTFYGLTGQRLSTFTVAACQYANSSCGCPSRYCFSGPYGGYIYFGGKLILEPNGSPMVADRLGSQRNGISYDPWGEEQPQTYPGGQAPDGQVKFGTYFRDMPGQDYADQRYYNSDAGRFYTPDRQAGDGKNPTSLNKYLYVSDDPINRNDTRGLCDVVIGGITESAKDNSDTSFASKIGANLVFPYAGTNLLTGVAGTIASSSFVTTEAAAVASAINAAAADSSGPINIFAFSGGAAAFSDALQLLSPDVISRIQNVTYASPGVVGDLPTVNGQAPTVVYGTGIADVLATSGTQVPSGTSFIHTDCAHNASCLFAAAASRAGNACANPATYSDPHPSPIVQFVRGAMSLLDSLVLNDYGFSDPIEVVTSTITFGDGDHL